ncbi:hypothetical protein [Variovorax sp. Varisp36]|uniref:hypothetical protein n=1 Tax=Variovorax sp. Varisp36 TaxID=3243031 RepID=UPI0039A54390
MRFAFAERNSQRLNRGVGRFDASLKLLVDQSHQRAEFGARRADLFRVVHALWSNEFFETRVGSPHCVQVVDVIACLQRKRFGACDFSGLRVKARVQTRLRT